MLEKCAHFFFTSSADQNEFNLVLASYKKSFDNCTTQDSNGKREMKGSLSHDPVPPKDVFPSVILLFEDFDQTIQINF